MCMRESVCVRIYSHIRGVPTRLSERRELELCSWNMRVPFELHRAALQLPHQRNLRGTHPNPSQRTPPQRNLLPSSSPSFAEPYAIQQHQLHLPYTFPYTHPYTYSLHNSTLSSTGALHSRECLPIHHPPITPSSLYAGDRASIYHAPCCSCSYTRPHTSTDPRPRN